MGHQRLWALSGLVASSLAAGVLVGPGSAVAQTPVGSDLVVNGSFEDPNIVTGTFAIFSSIPGWSYEARTGTTSGGIEIQDHVAGMPAAGAGDQFVELDSNGPTRVFQSITTTPDKAYRLTYAYSARPGTQAVQNHFTVTAGSASQEIGPLTSGPQTSWVTSTLDFVATTTSTEISFLDLGPEEGAGGIGAYLDTVSVHLLNSPPDCSSIVASPSVLWPVNHDFVQVSLGGATDPDGDSVAVTVTGVVQDEVVGRSAPDAAAGPTPDAVELRSERDGSGDGRVYNVSYTATDASGATCSGVVTVGVPHDQAHSPAVDSGAAHNSFST